MSDNRRVDHAKLFKNDLRRKFLNFLRAQPWAGDLIRNTPFLHRIYSKKLIAGGVTNTAARPQPYTLWTPTPIDPAPAGIKPSEPPVGSRRPALHWTSSSTSSGELHRSAARCRSRSRALQAPRVHRVLKLFRLALFLRTMVH